MWLTLAAAGFFGIVVLITLLRAEKSIANGVLTVFTLLAIVIAAAATVGGFRPAAENRAVTEPRSPPLPQANAALPALSCIDDMAGELVLTACERVLFGSAESVAAAISYAASRLTRLIAFGDVAAADRNMTPELQALRHSIQRDRYGLAAYVLLTRDHCTPLDCAAFRSLSDHNQVVANMDERIYEGLVTRYAPSWNVPAVVGPVAALPSSMPTGRPTNADFPSAASTPPVSIMNPEPGAPGARTAGTASATANTPRAAPPPRPAPTGAGSTLAATAPARKPAPKPRAPAPVQIAPAAPASAPAEASAPAASND
jgi:hypothetical protein